MSRTNVFLKHEITVMVFDLAQMILRPGQLHEVREIEREGHLVIELVADEGQAGRLIGAKGQTIEAIRHLMERAGRVLPEPIIVTVVVLEHGQGRR